MNDLISRAEAIELKPEFLNPNVNRETKEQTAIDRAYARGWNSCNTHWIKEIIEDLPSAQPERLTDYSFEESCTDCPAYDTENHRCPRFNQVIRMALKDANLEACEDCISRQAAIDAICKACSMEEDYHKCDGYPETSTWCDELVALRALPSVQPEKRTEERTKTHSCDLIDRQAAIEAIRKDMYADKDYMSAIICEGIENVLNNLPSAQPERPIGEWIVSESEEVGALGIRYRTYTCPSCGWNHSLIIPRNFCPNCGSDNRGEES